MKRTFAFLVVIAMLSLACRFTAPPTRSATSAPTLGTDTANTQPLPVEALRDRAAARGLFVGAAVNAEALQNDPQYAETLGREFNMLTAENVMKFERIHPEQGRYDFSAADLLVGFAEANDMQVRGHTLVWHSQIPNWLEQGDWTKEELKAILHDHIMTVVGRYRGRVRAWDVVNEAIADDGSLRDTIWLKGIGPEYLDLVFQWAHEADPNALLFYNDFGGEGLSEKSDAVYALVSGMKERGIPIHGVGLQMHVSISEYPPPEDTRANIQRLGDLGLTVHITELDVRVQKPVTQNKLDTQAVVYREIMSACLTEKACKAFVMWGFTDKYSWVPWFFKGFDAALIFDDQYQPKPAYFALMEILAEK